jgi:uncharacterized lipoprotein YmbA
MRRTPLFTALLLLACASPPPTTIQYLLRAELPAVSSQIETPATIGLARVSVAPYLRRPGLVVESGDHQVRPARYHVWAEPLSAGLRRYLRTEISNGLGYAIRSNPSQRATWDFAVDITIDQFHGTLDGEAKIAAGWRITRADGSEVAAFVHSMTEPLATGGYQGMIDAEIALARELAAQITASLETAVAEK